MAADDVFLSRVTHDLRGELATMVAGIHYLLRYESGLGAPGRQMLDRVNGAGQRLRRLLDEMELAAWIDGAPANVALASEPGRLDVQVQAAIGRLEKVIEQRGVTMDVAVPAEPPEIVVDPELYGMALEHAIDFAIARSPGKTVHVVCAAPGGVPTLRIADAGGAVEPGALARIFEPFAEKDLVPRPEPGARRRERLGLGLAIARGIVAAHGGSLTAQSTPDGIELTLTLSGRDGGSPPGPAGCRPSPAV